MSAPLTADLSKASSAHPAPPLPPPGSDARFDFLRAPLIDLAARVEARRNAQGLNAEVSPRQQAAIADKPSPRLQEESPRVPPTPVNTTANTPALGPQQSSPRAVPVLTWANASLD